MLLFLTMFVTVTKLVAANYKRTEDNSDVFKVVLRIKDKNFELY